MTAPALQMTGSFLFTGEMDTLTDSKLSSLRAILRGYGPVGVAFSGGVDSAFLLRVAHDVLGSDAIALTIRSCQFPVGEFEEAVDFCEREGIRQIVVDFDPFAISEFTDNLQERCYYCKRAFLRLLLDAARANGCRALLEGSNLDDDNDYRPGMRAVKELGIMSPLREAFFTKAEIRELSRELSLPTWDKRSMACLASRIAIGNPITPERLSAIDECEKLLQKIASGQVRLRVNGDDARIEVEPADFAGILSHRQEITAALSCHGFKRVSLDLDGYRTGSMNK